MKRFLLAAAMIASCAGCRVIDAGDSGFKPPPEETSEERFAASRKLGSGILEAFRAKDFKALLANTPGELASAMREADFRTSCRNFQEKFGDLADFEFLTALETPAFDNLIWRVTFVRNGTDGRPIRRQLLFRLVTMPVDGQVQVASYGFL